MALRRHIFSACTSNCFASTLPPLPSLSSGGDGHHFPTNIIIAVSSFVAAVLFLVLTYYAVLVRRHLGSLSEGGNNGESEEEESEIDYHVWHIRTLGLEESAINSIAAKPYITGEGSGPVKCSVCLGDFCEGELVRLLPVCGHTFHVPCIDPWLRAHLNCPLCRTQIVSASSTANPISNPGEVALINSTTERNAQMSDQRNSEEEEEDGERFIETVAVTGFSTDYTSSSGSSCGRDLHENGPLLELESNSLGTTLGRNLTLSMTGKGRFDQKVDLDLVKQASSSGEGFLQKNLLQLGDGTTSASGRILLFQKYGRSRSSSVLPL